MTTRQKDSQRNGDTRALCQRDDLTEFWNDDAGPWQNFVGMTYYDTRKRFEQQTAMSLLAVSWSEPMIGLWNDLAEDVLLNGAFHHRALFEAAYRESMDNSKALARAVHRGNAGTISTDFLYVLESGQQSIQQIIVDVG